MLDIAEFAIAMHLIQSRLKGKIIPEKLPEALTPVHSPAVNVPSILGEEREAYRKAFLWKSDAKLGCMDGETACSILIRSGLSEDILARIWNLSDIDRDGKLSQDEFFVALHLTRFCKQGNSIDGSVNVRAILSQQMTEDCYDTKKLRLAEVQTEKRKLLSLKEKLCHEIAGGLDDDAMAQKVQGELDQVEKQIFDLEKDENDLRRTLQQLKDKSKRESFKPFDRSFLLKRQPTGEDVFLGASHLHRAPLSDHRDIEIQKFWIKDCDLSDFGVAISEDHTTTDLSQNTKQPQFDQDQVANEQSHIQSFTNTSAMSSTISSDINGKSNAEIKPKDLNSVYIENNNDGIFNICGSEASREEQEAQISYDKDKVDRAMDHVVSENKNYLFMNGSSLDSPPHSENRTDDEKSNSLLIAATKDSRIDQSKNVGLEKSVNNSDQPGKDIAPGRSSTSFDIPVEGLVEVNSESTAQSSAVASMADVSVKLGDDEESFQNDSSHCNGEAQPPLSPRSLTQEELIPLVLAEKKRKEEERAKQREFNEELQRKAREEMKKLDEESQRNAEQRKTTFEEERRKLEYQMSLAQEGQEQKKVPVTRLEAGRIIERELEEQRLREDLTRIETERMKEKERVELAKQKFKSAKKDQHPSAFQSTDLIQTPIFDEKGDYVDKRDIQGVRISTKRGSVVDLIESDVSFESIKPSEESVSHSEPFEIASQPQPLAQSHHQPVIRRAKDGGKPALNRLRENRKSIVELEIERQREREEETRKEAELARRIHAKQQEDGKGLSKMSEETKPNDKKSSVKPPSVQRKTEKFEKKSEELKAKEFRPKSKPEKSVPCVKNSELQPQIKEETISQSKMEMIMATSSVGGGIDAVKQRNENGAESSLKIDETEAEGKRKEEKELFRQMQEEERRRREAQRLDLQRIRKEVDRKEAEELMRAKVAKEEEKKKQRDVERKMAEEREKDKEEMEEMQKQDMVSRRTAFAAHKLILEQRVLKALEESSQESTLAKRRASSFDDQTDFQLQGDTRCSETPEGFDSGGVKLRKSTFEKNGGTKESKEDMRKKRFSLNLDSARRGMKERVPCAIDGVAVNESQAQDIRGGKKVSNEGGFVKAKSLGNLSLKTDGRNDDLGSHPVLNKVSSNRDETDSVDGALPSFSDCRIQRELEEQRMREATVKQEVKEREKWHRLEEGKKKTSEPSVAGKKEMSLSDIRRNPLPSKIQVKKPHPSSNRDSLTHSMAAHWETMLHSVPNGNEAKDNTDQRKKSVIELEKEEERRREEELQKEREVLLLERKQKEEENRFLLQRKREQEDERKRKEKEEKEKRQQRTSAMKSLFEKMGGK